MDGRRIDLRYLLAAGSLGVLAAFVVFVVLGIWHREPLSLRWLHPAWLLPMVFAVAAAAWMVRPLLRRPGRWSIAAGSLLALLSAALFGFQLLFVAALRDGGHVSSSASDALQGLLFGPMVCVCLGFVTLPLGWLFAWILRAVPPLGTAGRPRPAGP
jgi:hypothetical protein